MSPIRLALALAAAAAALALLVRDDGTDAGVEAARPGVDSGSSHEGGDSSGEGGGRRTGGAEREQEAAAPTAPERELTRRRRVQSRIRWRRSSVEGTVNAGRLVGGVKLPPEGVHLVDRFVAAGAEYVFVGPRTSLRGPPGVVQALERHDDHLHFRLPAP